MTKADLARVLAELSCPRLLVVGDLMLDRYTWGNADRLSQEAPVAVLRTNRCEERLGGAANVCHMVHALQSRVTCAGVVGADRPGHHLTSLLFEVGIDCGLILVDPARPTTLKERFVGLAGTRHPSQMLRVDTETDAPIPAGLETQLKAAIQSRITDYDAVLISDYNKGVLTPALTAAIIQAARAAGRPVLVDPGRGRDFAIYRGATLLKPNRVEAAMATGRSVEQPQDAISAGRQLCRQHDLDMTIVTLDSDGMACRPRRSRRNHPHRSTVGLRHHGSWRYRLERSWTVSGGRHQSRSRGPAGQCRGRPGGPEEWRGGYLSGGTRGRASQVPAGYGKNPE